jgi:hypothetical protein
MPGNIRYTEADITERPLENIQFTQNYYQYVRQMCSCLLFNFLDAILIINYKLFPLLRSFTLSSLIVFEESYYL